jgi:hypothetical protein
MISLEVRAAEHTRCVGSKIERVA